MLSRDDAWKIEYARRKAVGQAIFLSPDIDSYQPSARAFILTLDNSFVAALSSYLGLNRSDHLFVEMTKPGFLRARRGVVHRLAAWGWNPFGAINKRPTGAPIRDRTEAVLTGAAGLPLRRMRQDDRDAR